MRSVKPYLKIFNRFSLSPEYSRADMINSCITDTIDGIQSKFSGRAYFAMKPTTKNTSLPTTLSNMEKMLTSMNALEWAAVSPEKRVALIESLKVVQGMLSPACRVLIIFILQRINDFEDAGVPQLELIDASKSLGVPQQEFIDASESLDSFKTETTHSCLEKKKSPRSLSCMIQQCINACKSPSVFRQERIDASKSPGVSLQERIDACKSPGVFRQERIDASKSPGVSLQELIDASKSPGVSLQELIDASESLYLEMGKIDDHNSIDDSSQVSRSRHMYSFLCGSSKKLLVMMIPWFTLRSFVTLMTLVTEIYITFWQTDVVKLNRTNASVATIGMVLCDAIASYCFHVYLTKRSRVSIPEKRLLALDAIAALGLGIENTYKFFHLILHGETSTFRSPASIVVGLYLLCHTEGIEIGIAEGYPSGDSIV